MLPIRDRHYLCPIYRTAPGSYLALASRRRNLPTKYAKREGTIGLFGGGQEGDETRVDTILRELAEELPALPLTREQLEGARWCELPVQPGMVYTVTFIHVGDWSQDVYRLLAGSCHEGYVDTVSLAGTQHQGHFSSEAIEYAVYAVLSELT